MERFTVIPAVHVFLFRNSNVLLLRRYQTGYQDGNYSVPAGHMDGGETVKQAAIREVHEECGIDIAPCDLIIGAVMHRKSDSERIDFFLEAHQWSGVISNQEPDKCDDLRWFSTDHLPTNLIPYVRYGLESVLRNDTWFLEFGWKQ